MAPAVRKCLAPTGLSPIPRAAYRHGLGPEDRRSTEAPHIGRVGRLLDVDTRWIDAYAMAPVAAASDVTFTHTGVRVAAGCTHG